jgi:hypothetical protein
MEDHTDLLAYACVPVQYRVRCKEGLHPNTGRIAQLRAVNDDRIALRYVIRFVLTVRPCKALKIMYVRGGQTCFGAFRGKKSYRDVR